MSRVLIPVEGKWYDELKAVGYYGESELERVIRQHLRSLFPDFFVFPFKRDVVSKSTSDKNRPDLAMVRKDFCAWGVIEVELSEHSLNHVLEQTSCFADGTYNAPAMAEYIRRQMKRHCKKSVSLRRLHSLIADERPTVLVIADSHVSSWQQKLEEENIDLCIFQIFKNTGGRYIYRILGDYPIVPFREAHCRRHASLDNVVEVVGNFEFTNLRKNKQVDVVFDAILTRWAVFVDQGKNYLQFLGKVNPLSPNVTYGLFADRANKYYFKIN